MTIPALDLDPGLTFGTFVVGPANRLAAAAAKRAARSPGRSFNPLFIHSTSGLGKSHLLIAIANQSVQGRAPLRVLYQTLEEYLGALAQALKEAGKRKPDINRLRTHRRVWSPDERRARLRDSYRGLELLLLDDVQLITGHPEAQEMLLEILDGLTHSGGQIVLAGDRPPDQIDGLDARLVSRLSGGLTVDVAMPEPETLAAILCGMASGQGAELAEGTADVIARHPFENIHQLKEGLNRVLAVQETEDRLVPPDEIASLLGLNAEGDDGGEFASFMLELAETVATAVLDPNPWQAPTRERVNGNTETAAVGSWAPSPEMVVWDWPRLEERIADESG